MRILSLLNNAVIWKKTRLIALAVNHFSKIQFLYSKANMNAMQGAFNIEAFESCKNIVVDTITVYGVVWEPSEVSINDFIHSDFKYSQDLGRFDVFQVDTDLCEGLELNWNKETLL